MHRPLGVGVVQLDRVPLHAALLHVRNHADDSAVGIAGANRVAPLDHPTDRVLAAEQRLGPDLVHDHNRRPVAAIRRLEETARE